MEIQGQKKTAKKIADIMIRGGIKIKTLAVLGNHLHIDTYLKYEDDIKEILTQSGWSDVSSKNGLHMDNYHGLRITAVYTGTSINKRIV